MKYINFIVGSVGWIQYLMPIAEAATRKGYQPIFFLRTNRKKYADPYTPAHLNDIRALAAEYKLILKDIKEVVNYPGLTFLMEGDLTGQQKIDYDTAGMHYLKPYHLKVSINFNADFIWSYKKYIDKMDYVILPNEIYAKTYNTLSPKNRYIGSPKFDVALPDKAGIYKKYGLNPKQKYCLFFYPKKKWWQQSKILNQKKAKFNELFVYLRRLGFKIIIKTREKDSVITSLGDHYFEDLKLYPNSSVELLKIADLSIIFSSTALEECVLYDCPFIDFKVDPDLDRYVFLNHPAYSKIISNFNVDFSSFSTLVNHFLNHPEERQKAFQEVRQKYLFEVDGMSDRIVETFLKEGQQRYDEASKLLQKLSSQKGKKN